MRKMSQPLKRRLLKEFSWLAAGGLLFLIYTEFLGPRLMPVLEARDLASALPQVNVVLQQLADLGPSPTHGITITAYGNSFEAPWKDVIRRRVAHDTTIIVFASDRGIWVQPANYKYGGSRLESEDDRKGSPFDRELSMLSIIPTQVRFFDSPRVSAKRAMLLLNKAIGAGSEELKTGAYQFQTSSIRGFQIGNPSSFSTTRLLFFDSNGNSLGEMICFFGKPPLGRGTQADLNRIIQTFHPLAPTVATSTSAAATNRASDRF